MPTHKDWRDILDRLKKTQKAVLGVAAFIAALASVVAVARDQFWLVLSVSIAVCAIIGIAASVYIVLARRTSAVTEQRVYRFSRSLRGGAIAAVVTAALVIAFTTLIPNLRRAVVRAVMADIDARSMGAEPTIAQLQLAEAADDLAFDVTVNNPLDHPLLLKKVTLSGVSRYANVYCCCPASTTFRISQNFVVTSRYPTATLAGSMVVDDNPHYRRQVRGALHDDNCSARWLLLTFDTAVVVAPRSYSDFRVVVPQVVGVDVAAASTFPPISIRRFNYVEVACTFDRVQQTAVARIGRLPDGVTALSEDDLWLLEGLRHRSK